MKANFLGMSPSWMKNSPLERERCLRSFLNLVSSSDGSATMVFKNWIRLSMHRSKCMVKFSALSIIISRILKRSFVDNRVSALLRLKNFNVRVNMPIHICKIIRIVSDYGENLGITITLHINQYRYEN